MADIEKQWPEHSPSLIPLKMNSSKDSANKQHAPIAITVSPQVPAFSPLFCLYS